MASRPRRGHSDGIVGERRAADRAKGLVSNHKLVADSEALADGKKRLPFALFRTLPVTDVNRGRVVVARRQSRANAGVHASAEQDDGA